MRISWSREVQIEGKPVVEGEYFRDHAGDFTVEEWARMLGRTTNSVDAKARRLGVEVKTEYIAQQPEKEDRIYYGVSAQTIMSLLRNGPVSAWDLSSQLDRGIGTIHAIIAAMQQDGFCIRQRDNLVIPSPPGPTERDVQTLADQPSERIAIGMVSDTHGGSEHAQYSNLKKFVHIAKEEFGVEHILHSGDITDGQGMYEGQVLEQYAHGADEQVEDVLENLPGDVEWWVISGNHDWSFYKGGGIDVVRLIAQKRDDIHYVGAMAADVPLTEKVDARLWHPGGGVPYALCLSQDTEILTRDGWVGWEVISMSHEVATLNPETHEVEYQTPTALFVDDYEGPMLHVRGRCLDHLVTLDHDLYAKKGNEGWHKTKAKEFTRTYKDAEWQMLTGDATSSIQSVAVEKQPWVVGYAGKIWCVTVPNGLIYARRNRRAVWTGNSYRGQKYVAQVAFAELEKLSAGDWEPDEDNLLDPEQYTTASRIRLIAIGHLHINAYFCRGSINVFQVGCFQGQSEYLKRKGLFPNIGAWVLECEIAKPGLFGRITPHWIAFTEIADDYQNQHIPRNAQAEIIDLNPLYVLFEEEAEA